MNVTIRTHSHTSSGVNASGVAEFYYSTSTSTSGASSLYECIVQSPTESNPNDTVKSFTSEYIPISAENTNCYIICELRIGRGSYSTITGSVQFQYLI